jgi:hypothetical protein
MKDHEVDGIVNKLHLEIAKLPCESENLCLKNLDDTHECFGIIYRLRSWSP